MSRPARTVEMSSGDLFLSLQTDKKGFEKLSRILRELTGINLALNNKNLCLMASRLSRVIDARGLKTFDQFSKILDLQDAAALQEFVSAMTTNTTQFYREAAHFEILKKLIPAILNRRPGAEEFRVWCAAASTGQEPYTILMTLLETFSSMNDRDKIPPIRFLATDIDLEVLEKSVRAVYTEQEVAALPAHVRQKYFDLEEVGGAKNYRASGNLRKAIRFAPFNLMTNPYPFEHGFDLIFCRNVLIYFDAKTAADVVNRLALLLKPNGLLFLGHSESGVMKSPSLRSLHPAVYERIK